ncbi:MAG TPA: hypothetical protein VN461_22720 [Vicinamibacteria bacterium]|nr:hypothetical protein [Vicinamibacteria bacterium]
MPAIRRKTRTTRLSLTGAKAKQPLDLLRPGMPALDSIHDDSVTFKSRPRGPTYRILKTTEVDSYETTPTAIALGKVLKGKKAPAPAAIAAAVKTPAPGGENFAGTARKAAKLSIANAPTENFNDLSKLIASLPSVEAMVKLNIPTTANSDRVQQEKRNVHVSGFLFAASREADNDFHLIVGRDPKAGQEMYMTMELSGLPPANSPAFGALNAARTAYKQFFGTKNLPGAGYNFYQPPIPVQIDGSLFFDATHSTGQAPGPPSLKSRMPTIFEVHPITKIKLGP